MSLIIFARFFCLLICSFIAGWGQDEVAHLQSPLANTDKVPMSDAELLPKDLMEDEPSPYIAFCEEMESLASSFDSGEFKGEYLSVVHDLLKRLCHF